MYSRYEFNVTQNKSRALTLGTKRNCRVRSGECYVVKMIRNSNSKTRGGGEISEGRYRRVYYIDLSGIVVKAETYDLTQPVNPLMSEMWK